MTLLKIHIILILKLINLNNRVLLKITSNYRVNFNIPNSINTIFGFEENIFKRNTCG